MSNDLNFAVLGAGAIGCFLGGLLAHMGHQPTLIGRAHVVNPLKGQGITLDTDQSYSIRPEQFNIATRPEALANADIIFIATKATALDRVTDEIKTHAKPTALVVCLLNGIAPVRFLRASLPEWTVLAGMVPYNVIWRTDHELEQSSLGQIALEDHELTRSLGQLRPDWFEVSTDLDAIQNGKLLLNLINPVNALSGMPVVKMLADKGYRLLYADAVEEALSVYKAAGLTYKNLAALPMPLTLKLLRGPDWLVEKLVIARQKLSPNTMSSMAQDYAAQRPTEIDVINGEIVTLGQNFGIPTPINSALVHWIKDAPERGWPHPTPGEIRLGL